MARCCSRRRVVGTAAAVGVVALGVCLSRDRPRLWGLLTNTALLTAGALSISLPVGSALGIVAAKIDVPGRRLLLWLLAAMLLVPLYVQTAGWQTVLGPGGWLAHGGRDGPYGQAWLVGWQGAIWVHGMAAVPWAAIFVATALRAVERRLEEESLLDASAARVLRRVSLRRAAGGVIAAAAWIAVVCATEIAVTDVYQIRTVAEEAYTEASLGPLSGVVPPPIQGTQGSAAATTADDLLSTTPLATSDLAVAVVVLAAMAMAGLGLMARWLPRATTISAEGGWMWRPRRGRRAIGLGAWALAAVVILAPLAGLAWRAGIDVHQEAGGYVRQWSASKAATLVARSPWDQRREWGWSLAIGSLAAGGAVVVGAALAWMARTKPSTVVPLAAATALAAAIPAPLVGVWVIELLNRPADSPLSFLTTLYDRTLLAPALVETWRALPLVGLWLWSQLATVPVDLLEAARSEGAGPWTRFFRVALPLRVGAFAIAAVVALVLAVGELSATLLASPPGVTTISVRVFQLLHYGADDRVAALCLSIFAILGVAAVAAAAWTRRADAIRQGASGAQLR